MLGGLARWLRILGQFVVYDFDEDDQGLLAKAAAQGLILLTRDEELHKRAVSKKLQSLLITGEKEDERLGHLSKVLGIPLVVDMTNTLCPQCGGSLHEVPKMDVEGKVPEASLRLYNQFWSCKNPSCGKIFWRGGHWKQISQTLLRARIVAGLEK